MNFHRPLSRTKSCKLSRVEACWTMEAEPISALCYFNIAMANGPFNKRLWLISKLIYDDFCIYYFFTMVKSIYYGLFYVLRLFNMMTFQFAKCTGDHRV